jgi:hypothetical protein
MRRSLSWKESIRLKIVLEGTDEFEAADRSELAIDKEMKRLSAGEVRFLVEDGNAIMAHLARSSSSSNERLTF